MKKTYFKKSLSVIMAVLMIMSCWVFVPGEHNHAEAINYGTNDVNQVTGYVTVDPVIYVHGTHATVGYSYMTYGSTVADGTYVGEFHTNVSVSGKTLSSITCVDTNTTLTWSEKSVWNATTNLFANETVLSGDLGGGYGSINMDTKDSTATLKFTFSDGTYELRTLYVKTNPVAKHALSYAYRYSSAGTKHRRYVAYEVLALGSYGFNDGGDYNKKKNYVGGGNEDSSIDNKGAGAINYPHMYAPYSTSYKAGDMNLPDLIKDTDLKIAGYHAMGKGTGDYPEWNVIPNGNANYYLDLSAPNSSVGVINNGNNNYSIKMFVGSIYVKNDDGEDKAKPIVADKTGDYQAPCLVSNPNNMTCVSDSSITGTVKNAEKVSFSGCSTISFNATTAGDYTGRYYTSYKHQIEGNNNRYVIANVLMNYAIHVVDKSELRNVYNQYIGEKLEAKYYTSTSWNKYSNALLEADVYLNNYEVSTANEATLKANLEAAYKALVPNTYDISYENLFSFSEWAKSTSRNMARGNVAIDLNNGTITTTSISASQKNTELDDSNNQDTYTAHGDGEGYYYIAVDPSKQYTFEYTVDQPNNHQCYVFFADENRTALTGNDWFVNHSKATSGNTKKITFTPPEKAAYVQVRFGSTGAWDHSIKFSDIALYETARAEEIELGKWTNREYRKVFNYGDVLNASSITYVPARPGYAFKYWYLDIGGTPLLLSEFYDKYNFNASWTVFSEWSTYPYDVNYENLFSFSEWANSYSANFGGTKSIDATNGTVTLTNNSSTTEQVTASSGSGNRSQSYYAMPVEGGKEYTFEYTSSAAADTQGFVFFYADDTGASLGSYGEFNMGITTAGKCSKSFTAPAGAKYAEIRFDVNKPGESTTFSNVRFYETSKSTYLDSITNLKVRDVITSDMTLLAPKRVGYSFKNWTTAGGTVIDLAAAKKLTAGTTLYANWTPNSYNITYNSNDGTNITKTSASRFCGAESALDANTFTRTGYTFSGWNTQADGKGTSYSDKQVASFLVDGGSVTLYAQWTINKYTVKFVNSAGNTVSEKQYDYGTEADDITKPANTANSYDNTQHYSYSWPTLDKVTGDATYNEVKTGTAHSYTYTYKDATNHTAACTCGYSNDVAHTQSTAATCTAAAYCDVCKQSYGIANGHDFTSGTFNKVTDGENGTHQQKCKNCNECGDETAHTWNDGVIDPDSTCISAGTKTYTCTAIGCDATYTEAVNKKAHTLTKTDAKDAKCEEAGNYEYWTCSECKGVFSDEEGTNATTVEAMTIAELGHSFTGSIKSYEDGTHNWKCTRCDVYGTTTGGADKTTTCKYTITEKADATCIAKGHTTYICNDCDYGYSVYTDDVDSSNHDGDTEVRGAKTANCHEKGYTGDTYCLGCNNVKETGTEIAIDSSNHDGDTEVRGDKTANCHEKGYTGDTYCLGCNNVKETGTEIAIDSSNHDGDTEVRGDKTANCHEKGYTGDTYCLGCNDVKETGTETAIDSSNHVNTEEKAQQDATCTADGYKAGKYCNDCKTWVSGHEKIDALDHDYSGTPVLTRPVKQADNTWADGYYTYTCKNNAAHTKTEPAKRADYTEYDKAIEKLEDLLDQDITDEAKDAINEAIEEAKKLPDNLIDSEQSNVDEVVAGIEKAIEKNSGTLNFYTVTFVDGDGTTIKTEPVASGNAATAPETATKTADATYHYTFSGWDKAFTNVTADMTVTAQFTGAKHDYKQDAHQEPKCTEDGYHIEKCGTCGKLKKTTIEASGHDYVETPVAATCKVKAHTHYQCNNCEYNYDGNYTGGYGPHHWFIVDPGKEATCSETGYTEHSECLVCGDEIKSVELPKLQHVDSDKNGKCDNCDGTMLDGDHACGCICHKDSFIMRIIYAIANFFWRIFKINKECSCGSRVHY